jgi:redox-regulated HSP33 family molecular chaperone
MKTTSPVEQNSPRSAHKRRMNELIHESLSNHLDTQPIAFFCECSSEKCFETVWRTAYEYSADRLVLAPGH